MHLRPTWTPPPTKYALLLDFPKCNYSPLDFPYYVLPATGLPNAQLLPAGFPCASTPHLDIPALRKPCFWTSTPPRDTLTYTKYLLHHTWNLHQIGRHKSSPTRLPTQLARPAWTSLHYVRPAAGIPFASTP